LIFLALALTLCGCGVDLQTQAELKQLKSDTAVTKQKADDAAKLAQSAAEANPSAHPIQAAANVAKGIRNWSAMLIVIAGVGVGVFVGLKFTPISAVSAIGLPVCLGILAVSFVGAIFVPILVNPWVILVLVLAVGGFVACEIVKNKSALAAILTSLENEIKPKLGITTPPVAPIPSPALAKPAAIAKLL
jgi:hypothetical protein